MFPCYFYGIRLESEWRLPFPQIDTPFFEKIALRKIGKHGIAEALGENGIEPSDEKWFDYFRLRDGSDFLRWRGLFEFLISADGRTIRGRSLDGKRGDSFFAYLLGQTLSFSLIKLGLEPLHATVVVIGREAVGFLADCGSGKSTLAGAFLKAGYRILTDDLLILREKDGRFRAYPGLPRIKLFPHIGKNLLGPQVRGTPMNDLTPKLIIPLKKNQFYAEDVPLRAFYVIKRRDGELRGRIIVKRRLTPRQALLALIKNTFNTKLVDPARLKRQFEFSARLSAAVEIKLLSYDRGIRHLPRILEAVLADSPEEDRLSPPLFGPGAE